MVTQRVRIPCPSCSHGLHIRVEDLGRKGECKYCGHQFRPRAMVPAGTEPRMARAHYGAVDPGKLVETLERRLEKTWARFTAKQVSVIEQLMVALATPPAQPGADAKPRAELPSRLGPKASAITHRLASDWENGVEPPDEDLAANLDGNDRLELSFEDASVAGAPACDSVRNGVRGVTEGRFEIAGFGTDPLQFQGEVPSGASGLAIPPAGLVECLNRLVRERDHAREQRVRLEHEVDRVRDQLAERLHEITRLRKSAERLKTVRAERDRLNAERTMLAREAAQLQSRMVETQVALVQVGAELDDCRERLSAERQEWQQQRQELIEEAEQQLSRLRGQTAAEDRAERRQSGDLDTFGATLVDAECQECVPISRA